MIQVTDPPHIDQEAVEAEAARLLAGKQEPPYFQFIDAEQLATGDFRVNYLIPGILAEKQAAIIAGLYKTLKTTIGLDMAISLASGSPFLSKFSVPTRKRVLVLTAESGLATVKESCLRICDQKGISLQGLKEYFTVTVRVPRLDQSAHCDELSLFVKDNQFEVLMADPAYLMIDGADAGNVFTMGDQLRIFRDIATESDATPVLIHHAKKNNPNAVEYQPLELADLAWAGFAEFARQWILLSRRQRYEEGSGEHRLWCSVGGSAGHNGCWAVNIDEGHPDEPLGRRWDLTISDVHAARQESAQEAERRRQEALDQKKQRTIAANRQKIVDAFIGVRPAVLTKTKICERAGLSNKLAGETIAHMIRVGELRNGEKIKSSNGQEYDAYSLHISSPE
jgi:hypothetical protein